MPSDDLVICSDGQLARLVGPWAHEKLHYIRAYCDIFNIGMKDKWKNRVYIDLFSGPGKCINKETSEEFDGSPLIALKCREPFTHYFFNDKDPKAITALKSRVANISPNNDKVHYFTKDCNELIDDLIKYLPVSSLNFCFIDPTNWQIKLESVQKLTEGRRTDLAIIFHIGGIKRCIHDAPETLDEFFGNRTWKDAYDNMLKSGRHEGSRVLLNAYEDKLKEIGYRDVQDRVLVKGPKNVPLYYLIFASKHPLGNDFWDKISHKSSKGQYRMF